MLIDQIKSDQLQARKDSNQAAATLLTTLIGEAEAIGKNDGNRTTTNAEVVAIIKKFLNNIDFTINAVRENVDLCDDRIAHLQEEKRILNHYLPKQMTEQELAIEITRIVGNLADKSQKQMGMVMKSLKDSFDGLYDGKVASTLVKSMLQ